MGGMCSWKVILPWDTGIFWTTPEEVGERQPLELKGLPFKIVMDGRLDNRPELLSELSFYPEEKGTLSDAALILYAYERWGEHCLEHFIGEYALIIVDQRRGELLCGRDALGDRTLFYSFKGTRLVIASEPWAVAGADGSMPELDERALAYYFALKCTEDGQTLFKNVYELLPAQAMLVNASGQRSWRSWEPDPSRRVRYSTDQEYAEQFHDLLELSVRCRMRATTPVGVLMSGGLDSTSVASLAARMIEPKPLTTLSYVFDELKDCDERQYIATMKEKWGIHSIQIPCDDAWPYKDWQHWPHNPNRPEGNPYRLLKERAYQRTYTEGLRVLLIGAFGDHLYIGGKDFLTDLIADGRFLDAGRELGLHIRSIGLRRTWQTGYVQWVARNWLNRLPGGMRIFRRPTIPAWLTSYSARQLPELGSERFSFPALDRHRSLLGLDAALSSSAEIFNANRHSLELRDPYRDRRLVEYVLALPAYQLYNHGLPKWILRVAMRGILPDAIRARTKPTSLISLYFRGVEREADLLQKCFQDPLTDWHRFVKPDWLSKRWNIEVPPDQDSPALLIPWFCISYEKWRNSLNV